MAKKTKPKPKRIKLIKANRARHMVITPIARVSFPQLFTPRAFEDNPEGQKIFRVDLIFDSKDVLKEAYEGKKTQTPSIMKVLTNVKRDQWGPDKEEWPRFTYPVIKNGDDRVNDDGEVLQGYADKVFLTAKTGEKFPPKVLLKDGSPAEESDIYGGCYARAQLLARPYQFGPNFGVKFNLLQLIKVKDGEKFGMPSDVFDISEDDDDESEDWDEEDEDEEDEI